MTGRSTQPQRVRAAVTLPPVDAATTLLGRGAAPASAAAAGVLLRTSIVCPPGQPAIAAVTRSVRERPPPLG